MGLNPKRCKYIWRIVITRAAAYYSFLRYVSDLFYDGKNSNSEAELRIKVTQFSTTSEKKRPGMQQVNSYVSPISHDPINRYHFWCFCIYWWIRDVPASGHWPLAGYMDENVSQVFIM